MSRFFLKLDPAGTKRLEEEGYTKRWPAAKLMPEFRDTGGKYKNRPHNFWVAPDSEWLMPRPRQFAPNWYRDPRLSDHVLQSFRWTFPAEIDPAQVRSYVSTRKSDANDYPDNQWMTFSVPNVVTHLDTRNYAGMCQAAGFDAPSTIVTVAFCNQTPSGVPLPEADFTPHIEWRQQPAPDDILIFGWANMAIIVNNSYWFLMHCPSGDGDVWEKIGEGTWRNRGERNVSMNAADIAGGVQVDDNIMVDRAIAAIVVGNTDLHISCYPGESKTLAVKPPTDSSAPSRLFRQGGFWVASPLGQTVDFKMEVVGFETASTDPLNDPTPLTYIDLGRNYKPALEPDLGMQWVMHPTNANAADVERVTEDNETIISLIGDSSPSNERIILGLRDEEYEKWESDGTHHSGSLRLHLRPNTLTPGFEGGFLAPQVKYVSLEFPVKLIERSGTPLELNDTQFYGLEVGVSLREALGKRIRFEVDDPAREILGDLGLDERDGYPVEVWEEVDEGDEESRVLRAIGWMFEGDSETAIGTDQDGPDPYRELEFEARGLLQRGDAQFRFSAEVVNPDSEHIEHDFAVKSALKRAAFDVEDEDLFFIESDPFAGTDISRLPQAEKVEGLDDDGPYNPDWNETYTGYADRVGRDWREWSFYEGDTKVFYHSDLIGDILGGSRYLPTAIIYRSSAEAKDADAPGQYMLERPRFFKKQMECNCVRITGKAPEVAPDPNRPVHYIDANLKSITDPSHPDFLGELKMWTSVSRFAVGEKAISQVARAMRLRRARRIKGYHVVVPLAPWEIQAPVEVGHVVTLQGKGDYLVTNKSWRILGRKGPGAGTGYQYRTTLTCEALPFGAKAGSEPGNYPGSASPVVEEEEEN